MRTRATSRRTSGAIAAIVIAELGAAGCGGGGLAFRVEQRVPPAVSLESARPLWITLDPADVHEQAIARQLAARLRDRVRARTAAHGQLTETDAISVDLAVERFVSYESTMPGPTPGPLCTGAGACVSGAPSAAAETVRVTYRMRYRIHDGVEMLGPYDLDRSWTSEDVEDADASLAAVMADEIARMFRPLEGALVVPVEEVGDGTLHEVLTRVVPAPTPEGCARIETAARDVGTREARARGLAAAGRCRFVIAVDDSRGGAVDEGAIARAESLLVEAQRLRDSESTESVLRMVREARVRARSAARSHATRP
ncbi:MAG: hypothetical protein OHK0013_36900 [Sandaracinaceae bacterium]